jgi:hypothetical protein
MAAHFTIRIMPHDLRKVKEFLDDGKKINAIKHARSTGKQYPGTEREEPDEDGNIVTIIDHRVGLKHAKDAVEHLADQNSNPVCTFVGRLKIKSFIVEADDGDVEMDLDGLQLRLLGELNTIPMRDVAEMLELVSFIRKWQGDIE